MQTIDEVQPRCRFVGEDGGVRGAPALPPDFAKCGGSPREKNFANNQGEITTKKIMAGSRPLPFCT